ncbi:MAG: hypothetical protein K1W41_03900 [Lachnospiraceae bacterium]
MQEHTEKIVKKSVLFEKSGETISIQIKLENVSPETRRDALSGTMDVLFKDAKETILS